MKLYDLVKELLMESKPMRNSDKLLMWGIWENQGFVKGNRLSREDFFKKTCPTPESVTRARRKVQEHYPALQATEEVRIMREQKEKKKGNFIYQDSIEDPQVTYVQAGDKTYKRIGSKLIEV